MDNGFIFPYQSAVVISHGGTRQGKPERGSTVQAYPGGPDRQIRPGASSGRDGERGAMSPTSTRPNAHTA